MYLLYPRTSTIVSASFQIYSRIFPLLVPLLLHICPCLMHSCLYLLWYTAKAFAPFIISFIFFTLFKGNVKWQRPRDIYTTYTSVVICLSLFIPLLGTLSLFIPHVVIYLSLFIPLLWYICPCLYLCCDQSCESRRQTISSISRPRFREIWKVSSLSRLLPLLVSPGSRPLFGFSRPNPAENESSIANL